MKFDNLFQTNPISTSQGEVSDSEENPQESGKRDYVQTLRYFPDPKVLNTPIK